MNHLPQQFIPISRVGYIKTRIRQIVGTHLSNALQQVSRAPISVIGAYNTSNVGDLAMGRTIQAIAESMGLNVRLNSFGATSLAPRPHKVVMGGGELGNRAYFSALREWSGNRPDKLAILGVNASSDIAELDDDLKQFLMGLVFISQRTKSAAQVLGELLQRKVHYQPDITFAMPLVFGWDSNQKNTSSNTVGISVCPLYMSVENQARLVASREHLRLFQNYNPAMAEALPSIGINYANTMKKVVQLLESKGKKVIHIPFTPVDDLFAKSIFKKSRVEYVPFRSNSKLVLNKISTCEKFIATRFHAHIFGLMAGVPVISIAYAQKCQSLWSDIELAKSDQIDRLAIANEPEFAAEQIVEIKGAQPGVEHLRNLGSISLGTMRQGLEAIRRC